MKREYRDENFEEFLKRNADNLRMKAPEKVWQNLSAELNKEKRRFGIGLSAFFLLTSVLGYLTISTTKAPVPSARQTLSTQQDSPAATTTTSRLTEPQRRNTSTAYLSKRKTESTDKLVDQTNSTEAIVAINREQSGPVAEAEFTPTIVDSYPTSQDEAPSASAAPETNFTRESFTASPWTIESATNIYLQRSKRKEQKFQTQFHFTPTISYRKLSENKSYLRHTSISSALSNYNVLSSNVNNMVTHKPDMGFEVGVTEKYSLSKNVRIRAGLQFNVNRYDIKAFQAPFALATITLNNRRTATVDSVWALANYSNVDVYRSNQGSWLQNYSVQVSSPIGLEVTLKGNDKMQFGIATSVQPTYVLGDRAYLITSDYKSYTHVPWLLRRWNVNTALETFVQYQKGRTRWQVGPQVRYQLLSSFVSNYPVKENLFDFGLKVGVSIIK